MGGGLAGSHPGAQSPLTRSLPGGCVRARGSLCFAPMVLGHAFRPRRPAGVARVLGLVAISVLGVGCTNLRYYTTYRYEPVRKEVEKVPLTEVEYLSGLFQDGGSWFLRVLEVRRCARRELDVSEEIARVTVTSPTWYYFLGLGALQASLSSPFWVLGTRADGSERRNQYLLGSLVFLVPGLAIMGVGAYFRLVSGTEERRMGQRRRVMSTTEVDCGVSPAGGKQVTLGTRTGPVLLGKTDPQGRIAFPAETARPLVRWEGGRPEKAYFEVFVEDTPSQEVRLPKGFPVNDADLREPTLLPGGASPQAPRPRP